MVAIRQSGLQPLHVECGPFTHTGGLGSVYYGMDV